MAVLLLGVLGFGYQDFALKRAASHLQLLPATMTLHLSTYGKEEPPRVVRPGVNILLDVIEPPGPHYDTYKVDLHKPTGGVESLPISASVDDVWSILVPAANLENGAYKLTVLGTTSGRTVEVGSSLFQIQIQK